MNVLLRQPLRDERQIGLRLLDRDAGLEPPDGKQIARAARLPIAGAERERHPKINRLRQGRVPAGHDIFGREAEVRRHDANHPVIVAAEVYALIEDVRIGAEAPRPQVVAENDDVTAARFFFLRLEVAAELWSNAEGCKEIG